MSGPLSLTAEEMRHLATALDAMSEITRTTGVDLAPYGRQQIGLGDNHLSFSWDDAKGYVIDDRNGD